jgi:hypothetical protein
MKTAYKIVRDLMVESVLLVLLIIALLLAFTTPASAQTTYVAPRVQALAVNVGLTNVQTLTLNSATNVWLFPAYQHGWTFWGNTVCTNANVVGTTTATLKLAYDTTQTNFIVTVPQTLVLANLGTTNSYNATNIPASVFDGATAVEVSTVVTTGQTNGANGALTGQTFNLFLNQTP